MSNQLIARCLNTRNPAGGGGKWGDERGVGGGGTVVSFLGGVWWYGWLGCLREG